LVRCGRIELWAFRVIPKWAQGTAARKNTNLL